MNGPRRTFLAALENQCLGTPCLIGCGLDDYGVERVAAGRDGYGWRKVRAPQGRTPGNARRGRPQGKCHREQTAGLDALLDPPVRVKGCGKSAPRFPVTGTAW